MSKVLSLSSIKKQFPATPVAYLDNAASTPTCHPALEAMDRYYQKYRANVHRGIYKLSLEATEAYETARKQVAQLINAVPEEIIFTSGATQGLNQLAYSLSPRLSHRDNVVLTRLEHHANLVPWQQMAKHYGFKLRFIELTKDGELDSESAFNLIDNNTKVVSFALVSNVLGSVAPAQKIIDLARTYRATTIIDAAQAMAHRPVDIRQLDCDFLVFSGHKMYGPTGIGVLYGKKIMLEEHLEPFFFGGEMVESVSYEDATWNTLPYKFEAGTPNIAGAIGLGAAAEFIKKIGWRAIQAHEKQLMRYALQKVAPEVKIVGDTKNRLAVIAFTIPGIHPHDIAEILNQNNVCVRAGYHCAEPLHRHLGLGPTTRLSLSLTTTKKDIDVALKAIKKAKKMFA